MKDLPDECISVAVTSPPYGQMRNYGNHEFDAELVVDQLDRIITPGGVVVWVEQDQVKNKLCSEDSFMHYEMFRDGGFDLACQIVMEKSGTRCPPRGHYGAPEIAFVFSKGKPEYVHVLKDRRNKTAGNPVKHSVRGRDGQLTYQKIDKVVPEFGCRGVVWRYDHGLNSTTKDHFAFQHPALMHEKMAEDLIISFSRPGDLVFDPMVGSGTTAKMALLNHRRFLGFEIHAPYVELAKVRVQWARLEQQRRLDQFLATQSTNRSSFQCEKINS
jgi:site-specific DNA-methyltransferase (adenine-specific)